MTVKELINELLVQLEEKGDFEVFLADDFYGVVTPALLSVHSITSVRVMDKVVGADGDVIVDAIVLDHG